MKEIYYVKPIQNSRRVPVADSQEPRRYLQITLWAMLLFGAAFWLSWQRFQSIQEGYRLETLQQEKQGILEANRKLRLEEAALGDPMRVEAIARNELGMTTLSPHQIYPGEALTVGSEVPVLAEVRHSAETVPPPVKNVALAVPR